jgi:poly(A) polymerase
MSSFSVSDDASEPLMHAQNGPEEPRRRDGGIPKALLDEDAVTVVRRLKRHGHEAYLVGGCVRDLLAGLEPKDFDVATDARPNRIKRVFRNARIIGRRFRLAHIHFGRGRIIETSTFRGPPDEAPPAPPPEEAEPGSRGRGSSDTVFGTAAQDARRRDFTINALFYDPLRDEILDYVGGLDDLEAGIVRSIGAPRRRIVEDPVRMLRAVHFAERMGFALEEELEAAIRELAPRLEEASQARLYVELVKILGRGSAYKTLHRLHDLGVLGAWTPEVAGFLDEAEGKGGHATWSLLGAADRWGPSAHDADESLVLAPLVTPWILDGWDGVPGRGFVSWTTHVEDTLRPMALRMSIPRRTQGRLKELLWLWLQMGKPPAGKRSVRLVRRMAFPHALTFLRLHLDAEDGAPDLARRWRAFAEEHGAPVGPRPGGSPPEPREPEANGRGRRRRGGRGRRRGGSRDGGEGPNVSAEAAAWGPAPPPPNAPTD